MSAKTLTVMSAWQDLLNASSSSLFFFVSVLQQTAEAVSDGVVELSAAMPHMCSTSCPSEDWIEFMKGVLLRRRPMA